MILQNIRAESRGTNCEAYTKTLEQQQDPSLEQFSSARSTFIFIKPFIIDNVHDIATIIENRRFSTIEGFHAKDLINNIANIGIASQSRF